VATDRADEVVADGAAKVRGEALRDALPDACARPRPRQVNTTRQSGLGWRLLGGRAIKAALLLTDDALDDADHALDVRDDLGRCQAPPAASCSLPCAMHNRDCLRSRPLGRQAGRQAGATTHRRRAEPKPTGHGHNGRGQHGGQGGQEWAGSRPCPAPWRTS
jgi:hypothetical protein